jgi:hypothetical protein
VRGQAAYGYACQGSRVVRPYIVHCRNFVLFCILLPFRDFNVSHSHRRVRKMKGVAKAPTQVHIPHSFSTISAVQEDQSVEIDISDVALAPGEGEPPVPLKGDGERKSTPDSRAWSQQDGWTESAINNAYLQSPLGSTNVSQFEEISPWSFQEGDRGSWSKARTRQVSRLLSS